MALRLQTRQASGKWALHRYAGGHNTVDSAIDAACRCDQDGIFPSGIRIVDDAGKVVVTSKSWSEQFRAAGMQPFRYV